MAERELADILADMDRNERAFFDAYADLRFQVGKASEAMRRAGLADEHTNPGSTWVKAHEYLRRPNVSAAIDTVMDSVSLSPKEIIARRSQIASSDIADILDPETGKIDVLRAIRNGKTHLIRSIKQRPTKAGVEISVELHDPQTALAALERIHGLDKGSLTVETGDKLAELLAGMVAPWADSGQDVDNT